MKKKDKQAIGIAGEAYVAAELSKRGFVATVTGKNTESIDILCLYPKSFKLCAIQVKTTTTIKNGKGTWILNKKNEGCANEAFFYVLVSICDEKNEFFIIPSRLLSSKIKGDHQKWLSEPGKNHKDSSIRRIDYAFICNYKDQWDLLK